MNESSSSYRMLCRHQPSPEPYRLFPTCVNTHTDLDNLLTFPACVKGHTRMMSGPDSPGKVRSAFVKMVLVLQCWSNGWRACFDLVEVEWWGFAGHSLPQIIWLQGRGATKNILEADKKRPQSRCRSGRGIHKAGHHLDCWGLWTLGWVSHARVPDDPRPKTPCAPKFITGETVQLAPESVF